MKKKTNIETVHTKRNSEKIEKRMWNGDISLHIASNHLTAHQVHYKQRAKYIIYIYCVCVHVCIDVHSVCPVHVTTMLFTAGVTYT